MREHSVLLRLPEREKSIGFQRARNALPEEPQAGSIGLAQDVMNPWWIARLDTVVGVRKILHDPCQQHSPSEQGRQTAFKQRSHRLRHDASERQRSGRIGDHLRGQHRSGRQGAKGLQSAELFSCANIEIAQPDLLGPRIAPRAREDQVEIDAMTHEVASNQSGTVREPVGPAR